MINQIKKWSAPPIIVGNDAESARARTINTVQLYFLLTLVIATITIPFFIQPTAELFLIILVLIATNCLSRMILFHGKLTLASTLLTITGGGVFIGTAVVSGGIASPLMFAILSTAVVSGLLIGTRAGTGFMVFSMLIGLALAILAQSGVALPQIFVLPPLATWLFFAMALLFTHSFLTLIVRNLQEALASERRQNEARRQAEITLGQNEARFRMLAENAQDLIYRYRLHPTPGLEYVSPSATRLTGYTPEELYTIPQLGFKLIYPEDRDRLEALMQSPDPGWRINMRWFRKDGSLIWVEQQNTSLYDAAGTLIAIEGSVRDISERMRAEISLRESQATLSAIVDSTADMIWSVDPRTFQLLTFNHRLKNYFLQSRNFLIEAGMRPEEIFSTQESVNLWRKFYQRALSEGSYAIEYGEITDDIVLQLSFNLLKRDEEIFGISIFGKDITQRKQAEEKIRLSEKKYRELFQVNKDGISIFLLNPETGSGKFVEVNESAHQMLGYTAAEMLELTPQAFEPDVTSAQLYFRQSELQKNGNVKFETTLHHKDGHLVYTEFTSQLIQYEGRPAIMNIVHDVTERKQHELAEHAIATLSSALRTAPTRSEMLPVMLEQIVNLLTPDAVTIEIIDQLTGDAIIEAAYGAWGTLAGSRQKKGTSINAIISQTHRLYYTPDLEKDPNFTYPNWASQGIRGSAGVPLIAQEKLIGYIWIGHKAEISASQIRLLAAITDIAANAIYRATLHEQALQAANTLTLTYDITLEAWARALELRDQETEEHSQRVKELTMRLAQAMGLAEAELIHIRRGAILHDIGKIGIPDRILHKPGALSAEEWEIMRQHPDFAYKFLRPIEYLNPAIDIPYCHHEKWDGSGYPRHLQGEQIPLAARLFAVVDVWDALRSDRPYRQKWPLEKVREYIRSQAGTHFDPLIVEVFLKEVDSDPNH